MSSIVVTGGAGFIGSHLVDRLVLDGHDVLVLDNLSTGRMSNLDDARRSPDRLLRFQRCDLVEPSAAPLIIHARPEVVFHLAAQTDVRSSVDDPARDATVNILGTIRLLEACHAAGTRKIVFAGSGGTIYGQPPASALPVDEDYDGHPVSPYGASQRAIEEYLHVYDALHGLDWTSLALSNVYGPRQDPRGVGGVTAIFGARMLAGHGVTINGDGSQTRDFVYVDDVVQAMMQSLQHGSRLRCNIATGRRTSVRELYEQLVDLTGYDQEPYAGSERPGELAHISLDIRRAGRALEWRPWTELPRGLAATLEWLKHDPSR